MYPKHYLWFTLLFYLLTLTTSNAQQFYAHTQSFALGDLSQNSFRNLCQDQQGFIWFATREGLIRFDGKVFKSYTENSHSFFNDDVSRVACDKDGLLWLFHGESIDKQYHLDIFDPIREQVLSFEELTKTTFPFNPNIKVEFANNPDSSLWIYSNSQVFEYHKQQFKKKITVADSIRIIKPFKTIKGNIWLWVRIKGNSYFWYLNDEGILLEQFEMSSKTTPLEVTSSETIIYGSELDNTAKLYSQTPKGISRDLVLKSKEQYKKFLFNAPQQQIWGISSTNNKRVDIFDNQGNLLKELIIDQPNFSNKELARPNQIHHFWDKEGRQWLKTSNSNSLISIQLLKSPFHRYLYTAPDQFINGFKRQKAIRGIVQNTEKQFYINTDLQGTFKLDLTKNSPPALVQEGQHFAAFLEHNTLWYNSYNKPYILVAQNLNNKKNKRYNLYKDQKKQNAIIWKIYRDQQKRLWLGSSKGLYFIDNQTDSVIHYNQQKELNVIFDIYENAQGLWFGTSTGLYLLNKSYQVTAHYHSKGKGENYLAQQIIAHIREDKNGLFWLATKGGGLISWNPKTKSYQQFNNSTGLPNNIIYASYEDKYNNIWMSSNKGIICMNKRSYQVINYLPVNGVTSTEFNTSSHYQDSVGNIYFGSVNGLTYFNPAEVLADSLAAPLSITTVSKYNNTSQQVENISSQTNRTKSIDILPSDRNISLQFALLDYSAPQQVLYSYKIKGLDAEWKALETPEIQLAGLPYGNYELLIRAKQLGRTWSSQPLTINLKVLRPFYLKWWFILFMVLLGLILIGFIFRFRLAILRKQRDRLQNLVDEKTAHIQQQNKQLKSVDEMKTRFFVNISHELRTPLTLILGPLAQLSNDTQQYTDHQNLLQQHRLMERNGKRLLFLIEEILDLSKIASNKLELHEDALNLWDFCQSIFTTFQSQAKFRNINYQIDYQTTKDLHVLLDKNKMEKVLINLIGNALKFTKAAGDVTFLIMEQGNTLVFKVKDTGQGISTEDLPHVFERFYQSKETVDGGTGVGLALSKEFAELMKGELYVESEYGQGSQFTFSIPKILASTALPLVSNSFVHSEIPLTSIIQQTEQHHTTILIVEDNQDVQLFIQSLLSPFYNVITSPDGQEAQDYLMQTKELPALIISDVMMPRMDGIALLTWLKAHEQIQNISVIMLTAKANPKSKLQALTIGVDDYLTKPFSPNELLARVHNLVARTKIKTKLKQEITIDVEETDSSSSLLSESDQKWIKTIEEITEKLAIEADFDGATLAQKAHISPSTLRRHLKRITGLSVREYIREVRLQIARDLLERGVYTTIAETAYAAGFTTPYYFSGVYQKRFGKKPSEYLS